MALGHFPPVLPAAIPLELSFSLRTPPRTRAARRLGRTAVGVGVDAAAERLACMVGGRWAWGCDGGGVAVVDDVAVDVSVDMFVDVSIGVAAVAAVAVVVRMLGEALA